MKMFALGLAAVLAAWGSSAIAADLKMLAVRPSQADHGVHDFDDPSIAIVPPGVSPQAPLILFLTGTGGRPRGSLPFTSAIAAYGFKVLALEYDDTPAVAQTCPRDPDPACSENMRQMRVDGDAAKSPVHNPTAEAIVPRLRAALRALAQGDPSDGWSVYLSGDEIQWSRIVVSGLSQGAGMAAYIAKHHLVARAVLFSSPWDVTGPDHHPAPWLSQPSATPPERWFAEYHQRENTSDLIRNAYAALNIPATNLRVFDKDLPADAPTSPNPFHVNTIRDRRYAEDWKFLYGSADQLASERPPG